MNGETHVAELLSQINERLGQLVALTAATHVAGLSQREAVEKLGAVGLTAKTISEITGFPLTSVATSETSLK